ncbi:PSD1 and planctomycete cytochrome C domain-containing protein [Aporhodopirellula aestuarii]|uniref:PSD1 and planctomycete cytochrome C domain-containing protein n=1 Tax=Aporhodopirellula aestuarii TaxID=2950107 RepID=A0ABT0U7F5_9BACT|nr:PSD1 and planctomycete cytochrome C domain-containing protein [Aporhodopirellula aestuarii]MCM2372874.1 PSD1 and planctomycete cytochrome C domain-containing protein [Aporhodopirellula aestuarii]
MFDRTIRFSGKRLRSVLAVVALVASPDLAWCQTTSDKQTQSIDFSDLVSPILSDKCFHCHGPDAENQESGFRADTQENLFADLGGYFAVVPGNLADSELHTRIHSTDPDDQMPPPDSNRSLTEQEKQILDAWIEQGAPYEGHWAFDVPTRPLVPVAAMDAKRGQTGWSNETVDRWSANPIDGFIAERLIEEGLAPSPPADYLTQLRRASLTLTGMLPPQELQDKVATNPSEESYFSAVDSLLDSMAYAERQSLRWLDAGRYADTDGYQNDSERTNWPWRDWVTRAFHDNMPFDQFTIEQIAGDMLPDATDSQRLATTFSRNHRQNNEGGALAEEFFVENVIDRVETTSTVFLGLTFGCARCHDHKYDPLSQKEFFQLYGYFNNIGERGIGRGIDAMPTLTVTSPLTPVTQEMMDGYRDAESQLAKAKSGMKARMKTWMAEVKKNSAEQQSYQWVNAEIENALLKGDGELTLSDDTVEYIGADAQDVTYEVTIRPNGGEVSVAAGESGATKGESSDAIAAIRIQAFADAKFSKPTRFSTSVNGNFVLTDLRCFSGDREIQFANAFASYEQNRYPAANVIDDNPTSGWAVHGSHADTVELTLELETPLDRSEIDLLQLKMSFGSNYADHSIGKFVVQTSGEVQTDPVLPAVANPAIAKLLSKSEKEWSGKDRKKVEAFYEKIDESVVAAAEELAKAKRAIRAAGGEPTRVMVMHEREGEPAATHLLMRGQYDAPDTSEKLTRGVPAALLPSADAEQPADRLDLSRWLTSRENPLTARVTVNRFWQDHFGIGLVKTVEDFGLQGETPSHPKLLDWLAVEFIESGWNVKAMHRLIVTSAAYRQSSRRTRELDEIDPDNRLLARGPRYRVDGFTIRDVALQSSGLLDAKPGGPSVKPYQPAGLWESLAANAGQRYTLGKGNELYRKSMYSYWKRAVNPPRQIIFDAGGREVCNVRLRRTNTPLQALVLMNDPTFIEAARQLAQSVLELPELSDEQRVAALYEQAIAMPVSESVHAILMGNLSYFRVHFAERPDDATKLLSIGQSKRNEQLSAIEHAAFTATAHLVLNLDEFISVQ